MHSTGVNNVDSSDEDDYFLRPVKAKKKVAAKNCTVMKQEDLRQQQEGMILQISKACRLSRASSIVLLVHYGWCVSDLLDKWSPNQDLRDNVVAPNQDFDCGICLSLHNGSTMHHAGCGHGFCRECMKGYIEDSVGSKGLGSLKLGCPDTTCNAIIDESMVNALACEKSKEMYSRHLLESYIHHNRNIKWCPAAGCSSVIMFIDGSDPYEVICECTGSFCWECGEDPHRPVDCDTVAKWISKQTSDDESLKWILANTKRCPRCKKSIQKKAGCNRMTCFLCEAIFCWLCLAPFVTNHSCNTFDDTGATEEVEEAKRDLVRYVHYYARYKANNTSMVEAKQYLSSLQTLYGKEELALPLCLDRDGDPERLEIVMKPIKDAWLEMIECRRLLMWSYVYGYYLAEKGYTNIPFFELVQGLAESALEGLHRFAEELPTFLNSDAPVRNFENFQKRFVEQVSLTRQRFESLVAAITASPPEICSAAH